MVRLTQRGLDVCMAMTSTTSDVERVRGYAPMFALRTTVLGIATVMTGLIAGLFYAYANSVMPALHETDDRTLVEVMNKINVVIINPVFMVCFVGLVLFNIAAAVLYAGKPYRTVLVWVAISLALNLIAFVITATANVPLNDQLANVKHLNDATAVAAGRDDFENPWVAWNIARAVGHTLAFTALCWALVQAGVQQGRRTQAR
jgi:uncharacterized membrane protein